jgi:hypothetical protein
MARKCISYIYVISLYSTVHFVDDTFSRGDVVETLRFVTHSTENRQSAKLFLKSELRLPHPLTLRRVCTLPPLVPGGPNSDEGQKQWYSR